MKPALLSYLACPACAGSLALRAAQSEGDEVIAGSLACAGCAATYRIVRGVPRFAPVPDQEDKARTAQAFGWEWNRFSEMDARYRRQFLDWIAPVQPEFFAGKTVLEGGCGKGRHTALAAEFGARAVVALDLSDAVDAAWRNTRHLPNAHIVQGDILHPPLRRAFDYAFSVGVLHHLPDPEAGFRALVSRLRPGGHMSAWVYGREGNGWIVRLVNPVREHVTSRLPRRVLDVVAAATTVPLWLATKLVYGPLHGHLGRRSLPYGPYLAYIADFPFREQRTIVFDHLVAPTAFYVRRDEFAAWFARAGLEDAVIEWHNANSWRGCACVPGGPEASGDAVGPAAVSAGSTSGEHA